MSDAITINHEIQKMLKDRGLWSGSIDGNLDIAAIEHLFFQMGINYAGWSEDRKKIAAEELFYETQGIDVGTVDGLDDHYIQHAREVYKAKNLTTWRDKVEEIHKENSPPDKSGSNWAAKYTLTQKALIITARQYDAYRDAVGKIESNNNPDQGAGGAGGHYYGMYQFGTAAAETTSAYLKDGISKEDFEGNQDLAEKHFDALSFLNHKTLSRIDEYNKLSPSKKLGVLGYAHNQGAGGAKKWLQFGKEGFDAFGTSGKKYYDAILKALKNVSEEPVEPNFEKVKLKKEPKESARYGVGIIAGQKSITDKTNENRPSLVLGKIVFRGFSDESINKKSFDAGSGGSDEYPSVPYGTYALSPQRTGSVISAYYENNGLDPNEGAFKTVYNVGVPGNPTEVGYDPKVDRNRSQIQIHSNVRTDENRLVSKGCLTTTPDDFPDLIQTIKKASEEGDLALVVQKDNTFTITLESKLTEATIPKLVPIKSAPKSIFFIGDSLAVGLYAAFTSGEKLPERYGRVGASPKAILDLIGQLPGPALFMNNVVILSAGLLNNVTDTSSVEKSIRVLDAYGASVRLVGGPITDKEPFSDVNEKLKKIAEKTGVDFLGSYEPEKDGIHPKDYAAYSIHIISSSVHKPEISLPEPKAETKFSLRDIDINQLKFLRGIGQTETHFSKKEAYSDQYNQESNNRNVREHGEDGADYGYYQCNELDVKHAIRVGVNPEIAKHLNGGGQNGKSSVAQQTIALHEYIKRVYEDEYGALKSGDDEAFDAAIERMNGKWFGLKDRPEEARKIWNSKVTVEFLFPEVAFNTPPPPKKIVEEKKKPVIVNVPKKKYNWPKQSSCEDFYGEVGTSQVKCQLPFKMVLAWDTGTTLSSYSCHKLVKEPMERIWNRVYEHYGYEKIVELRLNLFGGCLNVRKMRGGSSWSTHSWGIAVDIDPVRNALNMNKNEATLSKSVYDKYWEFIYDEGAIGLGPERDYDWMHWQLTQL